MMQNARAHRNATAGNPYNRHTLDLNFTTEFTVPLEDGERTMTLPCPHCRTRLRGRRTSRRIAPVGVVVLLLAGLAAPAAAQMRGAIERVGLTGGGSSPIRDGSWTTVDVQLANDGSATFDGTLRVEQFDRDRDVVVATLPVAVLGGQSRPYRVYFVPSSLKTQDVVRVRLFDARGNLVPLRDANGQPHPFVESNPIDIIPAGETVIVDLSNSRLAQQVFAGTVNKFEYYPNRRIRGVAVEPRALPERWHGLEFADAVVWDDADASTVEPEQLKALVDWVRNGGRLLITCGRTWQSLGDSKLAPFLPVRLTGVRAMKREEAYRLLPNFMSESEKVPDPDGEITRCVVQPLAIAGAGQPLGGSADAALIHRRHVGRGEIVFVAASFRELFAPLISKKAMRARAADAEAPPDDAQPDSLTTDTYLLKLQQLFRRLMSMPEPARNSETGMMAATVVDPYEAVTRRISFQQRGAAYLLFSILFAIAYCAVATLGTWFWLGRKNWRHHAWSAFTVVAIVGSAVGIIAVSIMHGFTRRVHDVQVVDAWANLSEAQASCLFGVRTPTHALLTLKLPTAEAGDDATDTGGPVCALPPLTGFGHEVTGYVAPATYTIEGNGRRLENVAVRATLKEFAGLWEGSLDGHFDGKLIARPRQVRGNRVDYFADGSFLRNNLNCDLRNCYLLDTQQDFVRLAVDVRCFTVGDLKKGDERRDFAAWFKKDKPDPAAAAVDDEEAFRGVSDLTSLKTSLESWGHNIQSIFKQSGQADPTRDSLQSTDLAMLLLATFDAYLPRDYEFNPLERSGGRRFGCLHELDRHHALLIGFADVSGPAKLEVNRQPLPAQSSLTMYRILIPVERP